MRSQSRVRARSPARLPCAPAAQAAVSITIDKSAQQMTVERRRPRRSINGRSRPAKRGYDTPSGKFKAFRMERDHYSKEWDDAPMPFSIFFTQKGHAIHGSLDMKRLGTPGLARLRAAAPANAEKLFALVEQEGVLNTTVVLTGTAPSRAPAVAKRPRADDRRVMTAADSPAYGPRYGSNQPAYGNRNTGSRPITRSRNMPSRNTRQPVRAAAIRAAAVWPAHLRPAAIRAAAAPGYVDPYGRPYQRPGSLFPY